MSHIAGKKQTVGTERSPSELDALLALSFTSNLGPVRIHALLLQFGSAVAALQGSATVSRASLARARACLTMCREHGIEPVGWTDSAYPEALRSLHDPPPVLFVRGKLPVEATGPPEQLRSVAVVGTRDPTARARGYAVALGREIAASGVVVVSGLALGIDGAAHEGALEAGGGPPLAVLAGGLDVVRPSAHTRLAERILSAGGALVSEDPPGLRPQGHRFVARNRIVSGLSRGVVVVEAGSRSGALHTAGFALDQGRDVLVVPDHPTASRALGNLRLLSQGATPVTRPSDVLEWFSFPFAPSVPAGPVRGGEVLSEIGHKAPCGLEQLSGEPLHTLALLAELEIGGFVARDGSGRYRLTHEGRIVVEHASAQRARDGERG